MVENFYNKVKRYIPDDDVKVILDLGSRDALQSIEFGKIYPQAKIFAFECNPASINECIKNSQSLPNVKVIGKAVHEVDGKCKFYPINGERTATTWPDGNPGASSLFIASGEYDVFEAYVQDEIEVESVRLDTWANQEKLASFDLVWLDLQGAELLALRGMGGLVRTVKAIHIEFYMGEAYRGQQPFPEINSFLANCNFTLVSYQLHCEHFGDAVYINNRILHGNRKKDKNPLAGLYRDHAKLASIAKRRNRCKAVIIYYTGAKFLADLKNSLSLLGKNFNNKFRYPAIIFHYDLSEGDIKNVRRGLNFPIGFERIDLEIPEFLNKEEIPETCDFRGYGDNCYSLSYRHMCRFFSGPVFRHSRLEGYQWYWRLDSDSFILSRINYDIFCFMEKYGYAYGYNKIYKENPWVVQGLPELTREYIERNGIRPAFAERFNDNYWDRSYFYGNFEISRFDFWRSERFLKFFECIDHAGGIYKYRWGDAPVRSLAVFMFMPKRQAYRFCDIAYRHQDFVHVPFIRSPQFSRLLNR